MDSGHRNAIHPSIVVFLCLMLTAVPMNRAAMGNDPQNMRSQNRQAGVSSNDVVPGVVVIKFRHSSSIAGGPVVQGASPLFSVFSDCGVTSLARAFPAAAPLTDAEVAAGRVDLSRIHLGTIPSSMNPLEVASRLAALPGVEYAEPEYYYYTCDIPNDSDYAALQQVYFDRMSVPAAWTLQKGSANVVIATVDGGTNWQHPDLKQNIWINPGEDLNHNGVFDQFPAPAGDLNGIDDDGNGCKDDVVGWNFTDGTNRPRGILPGNRDHGTKTASVFGAVTNNGRGMAGTSWNCRTMAVCAGDPLNDDRILYGFQGIEYAARKGAHVINCSWGRPGPETYLQWEQDVITAATQAGALVVAAAGNSHQNNDDVPYYPASYDHVLSVGATEGTSDAIAYFSDYGLSVSAFAPGMGIRVALDNGSYGTDQGTSDASPIVAGLAGLLKSAHPDWRPEQIAEQIRMTSDPIDASNPALAGSLGHGRVNFYRALSEIHSGVVLDSARFHKPSDSSTTFFTGDTVILSVKLKNILTLAAENLSFSVLADPELIPLPPIVGPTRLDAGADDTVHVTFRVGDRAKGQEASVRLGWNANAGESDARMFRTTVFARTGVWKRQWSDTTKTFYSVHAVNKNVAWASGTTQTFGEYIPLVVRTTDGGNNWAIVNGNLPRIASVCIFATDSLHAWVGGGGWGGIIFATVDGGLSWTEQKYPPPRSEYIIRGFWFFDAACGYALGDPGLSGRIVLLRTTDGGASWNHLANEPTSQTTFEAANLICATDKQHIWFTATDSLVYRSTDGGETWSSAKAGALRMLALAMHDDSVGIAYSGGGLTSQEPGTFARTTDGGISWQMLPTPKPNQAWGAAFPHGSNAWLAGDRTVACSPDHGETWVLEQTEPFSGGLTAVSFSDSMNGWMTTNQGEILHYHPLLTAVRLQPSRNLPVLALLHQNYPNPFNPSTTIRYELPKSLMVSLIVYDLLGREVSLLVNERRDAGVHQVRFDASALASGVYFYRLRAGEFVQSRKLLLIR